MSTNHTLLCLVFAVLMVFVSGCPRQPKAGGTIVRSQSSNALGAETQAVLQSHEIVEQNILLSDNLKVVSVHSARNQADLYRVQIAMENLSEYSLMLEYRFEWLDANGFKVPTTMSSWQSISVGVRDTAFMQGTAPTSRVQDYIFYLRYKYN